MHLYTIENLIDDPLLINTLDDLELIQKWLDHYKGIRKTAQGNEVQPWRVKINERKKEIKERDSYLLFEERVKQLYFLIISKRDQFFDRNIQMNTPEYNRFMTAVSRNIGNDIHDFPEVKTGLMTLNCYKSMLFDNKNYKPTAEHFWPRSVIGGRTMLIESFELQHNYDITHTISTLYRMCQTIVALRDENRAFIKHQRLCKFISPQVTIDNTNTELVRVNYHNGLILPKNWVLLFNNYNIPLPKPYQFKKILSEEEAKKKIC